MPTVTKHLLIINFICFVFALASSKLEQVIGMDLYSYLSLHYWETSSFQIAQPVTYMFLHSTTRFDHIFFNMFSLWMFGRSIEMALGEKRYLTYYILCGIGAAVAQELVWTYELAPRLAEVRAIVESGQPVNVQGIAVSNMAEFDAAKDAILSGMTSVGASGAVFGLLIAFAMIFPNLEMFILFLPIPIKAKYLVPVYAVLELYFGVNGTMDGVAYFAHLGGMVAGAAVIYYWMKRGQISRMF